MSVPVRPAPPKPVPKPGHVKVVKALYNYEAQQPDELSFEEGDTLYILDMITDPNWWKAKCGKNIGLIPSNYVEDNTEEIIHPLHEAAKRGALHLLQEHLLNKVSVNGLDKAGCTALHWAAHAGYLECINELLKVPTIKINVQNKLMDTPLHLAAWKGHSNIVKVLLEAGADPNLLNTENKTPYDLTKDSLTASILKPYNTRSSVSSNVEDYGDSEDSD